MDIDQVVEDFLAKNKLEWYREKILEFANQIEQASYEEGYADAQEDAGFRDLMK